MVMRREECVMMERKWPGGDGERRVGGDGEEQWVVMVTEGRVGGDGEGTVRDDGKEVAGW